MSQKQPNIIYICADQLAAKSLSCYGGTVDSTPVLHRLAEEGSYFTSYYATHPVCGPNRATMLTGRSAEIHGITFNNLALSTDMPTYAHLLKANGYVTGGFGKFHQTPMNRPAPENLSWLGFDECVVSEDPKWGPYLDWVKQRHPENYETALAMTNGHSGPQIPERDADLQQGASEEQVELKNAAYSEKMGNRIQKSDWERSYVSPLPAEVHDSAFITEMGLDFLEQFQNDNDKPFFCHISYVDPHDPYDPPEPYASMFDPDDMPEPVAPEWRKSPVRKLEKTYEESYLNYKRIADNPEAVGKFRALFHGSLKFLDDQIERIVSYLKTSGLWENTILVFSSDHGELLGDHHMIAKGVPHYDAGIRCPLIIAGGPVMSKESGQLCSTLDLFPTFCDWAGIPEDALPPLEGLSLSGICTPHNAENADPDLLSGRKEVSVSIDDVESVLTSDGWRLTRFTDTNEGQLFSLVDDPDELRNLYDHPDYIKKKVEMLERLVKVRNLPKSVPNYRNIAVVDGLKKMRHGLDAPRSLPVYAAKESPWLSGENKEYEWKGE